MKKILPGLLCIALLPLTAAQAATPDEVAAGLAARYSQADSLSASYSRVAGTPKTDKLFQNSSSQMATGLLTFSRPAKLLIDQKSPQPETMLTDGSTGWWYIPAESLAYRYRNLDVLGQLGPLLNFLSGLDSLKANFEITPAQPEKDRPKQTGLILTPKVHDGNVKNIIVWCDANFTLTGFKQTAVTGETTDFYLSAVTVNPTLDKNLFTFTPQKGVEIIDEE